MSLGINFGKPGFQLHCNITAWPVRDKLQVTILFLRKDFFTIIQAKIFYILQLPCRVFSHDVTAAILVSQNNETAAMLVSQTILWELNSHFTVTVIRTYRFLYTM